MFFFAKMMQQLQLKNKNNIQNIFQQFKEKSKIRFLYENKYKTVL